MYGGLEQAEDYLFYCEVSRTLFTLGIVTYLGQYLCKGTMKVCL